MSENLDSQKLNGNPARSPQQAIKAPSPEDISVKPHPAAHQALEFLKSVDECKAVSDIAKKIVMGHTSWAVRTVRTLLCELLNLPRERLSNVSRLGAFHFAIALQKSRKELALLHMRRGLLYLEMREASLAIADALRAVSLDRENSNGFFLLSSFLLEAYKDLQNMPPEMFRMAHKMAHIGYTLNPEDSHLELTFDVSVPPPESVPRVVDDEARRQVLQYSISRGDAGPLLFPPHPSRSAWWSNAFRRLIMETLPVCNQTHPFNYSNVQCQYDKVSSFFEQMSRDFDMLHFQLSQTPTQVGEVTVSIHCAREFSPGDVIFEERPYIVASTTDSLGHSYMDESVVDGGSASTSSQSGSAKESTRRKRYDKLRDWARHNDCPEVLLVWQYLVRLKEYRKVDPSKKNGFQDPFPYLSHPGDQKFENLIKYRYRFWDHYSAYIRLSWAWGFCKEHQEFDFEWYLDQVGTVVLNSLRLSPPPCQQQSSAVHAADDLDKSGGAPSNRAPELSEGIPGDMIINVRVEGSPFIPVIPGHISKVSSVMALFQLASFIPNDCINPTIEYNVVWKENGPVLQVIALKILTVGTSLRRNMIPPEAKVSRRALASFGSLCSCLECTRLPRPVVVDL
ncbi:uncharacterized protein LOC126311193 [Schistocerca gregaria]|uniref:uncharacterized protein LOC126311193 n=1 Tax=Schistocerca gregaria TaxID=7010 RepID=UPI00211EC5EA|nr:uncharacterized protein LOC126311193 [Schistocerca gregaria]